MKKILFVILALAISTASAGVFKCKSAAGKIQYQAESCTEVGLKQQIIDVKPQSQQEENLARSKLQAWQNTQMASDIAEQKAEKELKEQRDKQDFLNTQKRTATAVEQQALATQRLAYEQARRNNTYMNPYYTGSGYTNTRPIEPYNNHQERDRPGLADYGLYHPSGSLDNGLADYGAYRPSGSLNR